MGTMVKVDNVASLGMAPSMGMSGCLLPSVRWMELWDKREPEVVAAVGVEVLPTTTIPAMTALCLSWAHQAVGEERVRVVVEVPGG